LKGREAVAMLNAVVSRQLVNDKTTLEAWRVAHRVTAKQGAVRGTAAAVPATTTPASPTPSVPASESVAAEVKNAA
jgi:hypothetical protein